MKTKEDWNVVVPRQRCGYGTYGKCSSYTIEHADARVYPDCNYNNCPHKITHPRKIEKEGVGERVSEKPRVVCA